jgi:hypothetical protein
MWNQPSNDNLSKIPNLYETEKISLKNKIIHLHFFIGGCDWYIAEFDGDDIFFGFAILNGDHLNAEWGYISFSELKSINVSGIEIDNDLYWKPQKASKINNIRKSNPAWQ